MGTNGLVRVSVVLQFGEIPFLFFFFFLRVPFNIGLVVSNSTNGL